MNNTTIYVELDVHKDAIIACVGPEPEAPVVDLGTLGSQQYAIDRLLKKLQGAPNWCTKRGSAASGCTGISPAKAWIAGSPLRL